MARAADRFRQLSRPLARLRQHHVAAATAGYVAITVGLYWSVASQIRTYILMDSGDGAFTLWSLWAVPRAILRGDSPFHTEGIFHPFGVDAAFSAMVPGLGVVSWPLQKLFGLPMTANLLQFGAVVASAVGTYLLAVHVGAARFPAFAAGVAYAFATYRLNRISAHVNLNQTQLIPWTLWALLRLLGDGTRRPGRSHAAVLGGMAGFTFLVDSTYALMTAMAAALILAVRWRQVVIPAVRVRLAQAAALAALVGMPLLVPMVREVLAGDLERIPGWGGADIYSADLFSWVVPPTGRRFLGDVWPDVAADTSTGERTVFVGWMLLTLALVGALWGGRRRGVWVATWFAFTVLALGPFLQVNTWTGTGFSARGRDFAVPLPFWLLRGLPVLDSTRAPARFAAVAVLALAILAALGLTRLARARPRLGLTVTVGACVLFVAESFPGQIVAMRAAIPAPYRVIADDPGDGAVLEIPMQWQTGLGPYGDLEGLYMIPMYYATAHRRPLVSGFVTRAPAGELERLHRVPVYDQILGLSPKPPADDRRPIIVGRPAGEAYPPPTFTAGDLCRLGIGFVVTHRDRPRPAVEEYLTTLDLPVLADDGVVVVRKVPPPSGDGRSQSCPDP